MSRDSQRLNERAGGPAQRMGTFKMTTSIEPIIQSTGAAEPENLGCLHIAAERKHDRAFALRRRASAAWQDTPDWRFHRQVMRIGLYLRERAGLEAGDRVALLSALRPEWAVTLWSTVAQGAAIALIEPRRAGPRLRSEADRARAPRRLRRRGDVRPRPSLA